MKEETIKEELLDWLGLLIPGFSNIEVHSSELSGKDELVIYEAHSQEPFPKHLISDGTYNILCLLTAIFQSKEPQFLCIEEPENGLNPKVIKELVNLCRTKCEEEGHYIWLNTHSQTLVSALKPEELILVDKVEDNTRVKQITREDVNGLPLDEAWLSNALEGGLLW